MFTMFLASKTPFTSYVQTKPKPLPFTAYTVRGTRLLVEIVALAHIITTQALFLGVAKHGAVAIVRVLETFQKGVSTVHFTASAVPWQRAYSLTRTQTTTTNMAR